MAVGKIVKAAKKLADEWDEAAWLKDNPEPESVFIPKKDRTPEQQREAKNYFNRKSTAKNPDKVAERNRRARGPLKGREKPAESGWDDAAWLEQNPRPFADVSVSNMNKEQRRQYNNWVNRKAYAKRPENYRSRNRKENLAEDQYEKKIARQNSAYQENPGPAMAAASKRKAAKLERTPDYSNDEAIKRVYKRAGLLSESTGMPHEVDHVIPLQGKNVSGLHVPGNLMIVPKDLNRSKHANFTPGDDPMRFNDVAQENITEQNAKGLLPGLLAGGIGLGALGQSEDADAGGAASLVQLILKKFGNDIDGATQELVRMGGFPEPVARRIATGELPMDEASRVARRDARYADEGLVHVNRGGIEGEGFDNSRLPTDDPDTPFNAHWFTTDPHPSTAFRKQGSDDPLTYTPVVLEEGRRGDWRDVVNYGESMGEDAGYGTQFREGLLDTGVSDIVVRGGDKIDQSTIDALPVDGRLKVDPDNKYGDRRNSLVKNDDGSLGFYEGSEHILDYDDLADYQRFNPEIKDVAVLDNTIIRSPNAAFDPEYTGPNIMGGAAGTAGLAGLLAAGQSEESEAGVLGKVLNSDVAYNQLRKMVARNKQKGISPGNTVKQWMHDKNNTNYDHMGTYARKVDGGGGGDYYRQETQSLVDQVLNGVESPDKDLMAGIEEWSGIRQSRELGFVPEYRKGAATVPMLGATAAGSAGLLAAPALMKDGIFQHTASETPIVERKEPVRNQSGLLESFTDFGDEVFKSVRHAAGPVADVLMPYEGINNYLKTVNDYDKQPTWWDRLGILDF